VSFEELFAMACRECHGLAGQAPVAAGRQRGVGIAVRPVGGRERLSSRPTVMLEGGLERTASWLPENRPDFLYA
jgi:hypothetical protein